jgi:hypothetical protein
VSEKKKIKEFDAIEMKRRIQEEIYEETKDLSPEEYIAYVHQRIANSRFADFIEHSSESSTAVPVNRNPSHGEKATRHR